MKQPTNYITNYAGFAALGEFPPDHVLPPEFRHMPTLTGESIDTNHGMYV